MRSTTGEGSLQDPSTGRALLNRTQVIHCTQVNFPEGLILHCGRCHRAIGKGGVGIAIYRPRGDRPCRSRGLEIRLTLRPPRHCKTRIGRKMRVKKGQNGFFECAFRDRPLQCPGRRSNARTGNRVTLRPLGPSWSKYPVKMWFECANKLRTGSSAENVHRDTRCHEV